MKEFARQLAGWIREGLRIGGPATVFHPNILYVALVGKLGGLDAANTVWNERSGGLGDVYDRANMRLQVPRLLMFRVMDRSALLHGGDSGYGHSHIVQLLENGEFDDLSSVSAA